MSALSGKKYIRSPPVSISLNLTSLNVESSGPQGLMTSGLDGFCPRVLSLLAGNLTSLQAVHLDVSMKKDLSAI